MRTDIYLDPSPDVTDMARKVFPAYRGRKFRLDRSGTPVNVTSFWSEGSRDYFAAINLSTSEVVAVPQNGTPFDGGPIAPNGVVVPAGFMLVEHSIFMGKDMGITFHVDPETALDFLPEAVEVSEDEQIVLRYTSGYKNTYGGETNVRFREAQRSTGITSERWETAKASVTSKGMLNKAGAITNKGRNAVATR